MLSVEKAFWEDMCASRGATNGCKEGSSGVFERGSSCQISPATGVARPCCDTKKMQKLEAVLLRVYDLSKGQAARWSTLLFRKKLGGIWHSGINVFGREYFYGTGIYKMNTADIEEYFGMTPRFVHVLGFTRMNRHQFEKCLMSIRPSFSAHHYDLVRWNCNDFCDVVSRNLFGKGIPEYVTLPPKVLSQSVVGRLIVSFVKRYIDCRSSMDPDDPSHPRHTFKRDCQDSVSPWCSIIDSNHVEEEASIAIVEFLSSLPRESRLLWFPRVTASSESLTVESQAEVEIGDSVVQSCLHSPKHSVESHNCTLEGQKGSFPFPLNPSLCSPRFLAANSGNGSAVPQSHQDCQTTEKQHLPNLPHLKVFCARARPSVVRLEGFSDRRDRAIFSPDFSNSCTSLNISQEEHRVFGDTDEGGFAEFDIVDAVDAFVDRSDEFFILVEPQREWLSEESDPGWKDDEDVCNSRGEENETENETLGEETEAENETLWESKILTVNGPGHETRSSFLLSAIKSKRDLFAVES